MKFNKMDIRSHFEFRIRAINDDFDMVVCRPDGTYLNKNRENTLITNESLVMAERINLDEKTGMNGLIIPMELDEARAYVKVFNKTRKKAGWKPLEFTVLAKDV